MDKLEQVTKIGYWIFGMVGWVYIILVCRQMLRS